MALHDDGDISHLSFVRSVDLVDSMIEEAVRIGVSDIHIEPLDRCVRIRYRLDGVLVPVNTFPLEQLDKITSRIKIKSDLDIANKRLPQDGRLRWSQDGRNIDMRVSTMPTVRGEKTVIRLLDSGSIPLDLEKLGFTEQIVAILRTMIHRPKGLILLCGPTNSGKTTTLYAALHELDTKQISIATLEDPVEYKLEGICQSQINVKAGLLFHNGLRALLRQDPDILVIGEIRDKETASIAIRAALTGHLVFSTIHAGSALETPIRLMDMGIEPYMIADALLGVLSQRLVRRLCCHCRQVNDTTGYEGSYVHTGCPHCFGTGYAGRVGIGEIVPVNKSLRCAIRDTANLELLQEAAARDGALFMGQSICDVLRAGETDWQEIQRMFTE